MLKCFLSTYRIQLSMAINRWIYYLQKIPVVKWFIKDSLYHSLGVKSGLSVVMIIISLLSQLFKKGLYMAILVFPIYKWVEDPSMGVSAFIQIFIFFSVFAGTITHISLFQTDDDRRLFIRIMRINRSLYIRTSVFAETIIYFIFMFIGLSISLMLLGGNPLQALALVILALGSHSLMNILQMWIFKKYRTLPIVKHSMILIFIACAFFGAGMALTYSNVIFPFKTYIYFSFIMVVPLIYGLYKIQTYPLYSEVSQVSLLMYENILSSVGDTGTASFQDVAIRDKDLTEIHKDQKLFREKKGYAYLNAVFFHRQKRVFYRPIRNRILIMSGVVVALLIASVFVKDGLIKPVKLHELLPPLVFLMYFMSVGSRATRSLFYNCDVSLLDYSFYRRKDAVLKNFAIRLKYIVFYNLIPAVLLCVYFAGGLAFLKIPYTVGEMGVFMASIILLSILFSVHYLFIYYVFQPYTKDFNEKNPFYSLISSGMYIVCFSVAQMKVTGQAFVFYVLICTIAYIVISLASVYRFAPKTFRLR